MEQTEKVKELAETLKNRGLAASMIDAIDKAKNIIYGISAKKEEPKIEEKIHNQKEESTEVTSTKIDESNAINKDTSQEIKEVEKETSSVEIRNDPYQQNLEEVNMGNNDYDISKEEKTVNEVLNEKEEDVFISSHESDNLLKEEDSTLTEQTPETITTIEESTSEETTTKIEDLPEEKTITEETQSVDEEGEKKSQLTEEEKKKTDLSEIFNFGNR